MPTAKQIDAILPFLDLFTADGFSAGTCQGPPGVLPCFEFSEAVSGFQKALYDNRWITSSFSWPDWQETAQEYVEKPEKLDSAEAKTIQKLLTTHVRKERFCEGHLAAMFENGHIVALLRRLKVIRDMASARPPKIANPKERGETKDKSNGNEEPTIARTEKDQKAAELVLSLGAEGGGLSIFRTPLASGGWQFHEEGGCMWILDDDEGGMEEVWSHSTSKPVQTIQEMLPLKEEHDSWVMFSPVSIHREYRYDIWERLQEIVQSLAEGKKRWWADRRRKRWERFLRRKVELEPSSQPATFVFVTRKQKLVPDEDKSKDNEAANVSSEKNDRKPPEVVLELGVEGGGAMVYRTQPASGGWQFHVEGTFMLLDEGIGSCSSTGEPFQSIQEAIRSVAEDGSWVFYYPISIHPEYRNAVRCLVENTVRKFSDERSKPWKNHFRKRWWQKYGPESRRRQAQTDLFGDPLP